MAKFVQFKDLLEPDCEGKKLGVILDDSTLVCMCCGGILEEEDYEIIEEIPWSEVWSDLNKWD